MFDKIADLLLASLRLFQFFGVVDEWERAVVLRFGRFHREVGPGLHWLIPFSVDQLLSISVVPDPEKLDPQTLTTADGRIVTLRAVVTYQITDARKALLAVSLVRASLEDACSGEIGRLVSESAYEDLTAEKLWNLMTRRCRKRAEEWGVEVVRVQLSDIAPSRNFRLWTDPSTRPG